MLVRPAGLSLRAKGLERPEFLEPEKPATIPISDVFSRHPLPVLLGLGMAIISNSSSYLLLYTPTFGVTHLHLPEYTGFVTTLVVALQPRLARPSAFVLDTERVSRPRPSVSSSDSVAVQ
jgi:MFS transporter, MHS family, proline/betaine transporter